MEQIINEAVDEAVKAVVVEKQPDLIILEREVKALRREKNLYKAGFITATVGIILIGVLK
jgi:hypothetical protein